jgi:hypothetical protein
MRTDLTYFEASYKLRWVIILISLIILSISIYFAVYIKEFSDNYDDGNAHLMYNFCVDKSGMQPFLFNCGTTMINCTGIKNGFEEEYPSYCRLDKDYYAVPDLMVIGE